MTVAAAGTTSLPIDDHEAFVVQTAQEMRERGDWIVPHFHGKPRLTKPPLSYWAAAGLADLMGTARVEPWQARAASIAGSVGMVALTMLLAGILVDRPTAILAGMVAATSLGAFKYAHTARPDMLYAFWCTAMVTAFAWAARTPSPGRGPAVVLWLAAALATLTKGPQLPAMQLGACVLFGLGSGWSVTRLARSIRPVSGLALAIAVAGPWWWAVDRALPHGLGGTQLAGSLLSASWSHLTDPYFFYRPLALAVPSVAILVPALLWRRWPPWGEATRLLVLLVVVPAAMLSLGPQHRPHYMLPTLGPLCILLALTIGAVRDGDGAPWTTRVLVGVWIATIVVEVGFASSDVLWSRRRFAEASLATYAAATLAPDVPLAALEAGASAASYYARRDVRSVRAAGRLVALVDASPRGTVGLLAPAERLRAIPDALEVAILRRAADPRDGDLVLARVVRAEIGDRLASRGRPGIARLSRAAAAWTP